MGEVISDIDDLVRHDREKCYVFAYGTCPLGGCDYVRPVRIVADGVECETQNFHDKVVIPEAEYMDLRTRPRIRVGLWHFVPADDPAAKHIRYAESCPGGAGRELERQERELANLRRQLSTARRDALEEAARVADSMRPCPIDSIEQASIDITIKGVAAAIRKAKEGPAHEAEEVDRG